MNNDLDVSKNIRMYPIHFRIFWITELFQPQEVDLDKNLNLISPPFSFFPYGFYVQRNTTVKCKIPSLALHVFVSFHFV